MNTLVKVRFKIAWGMYAKGAIITPTGVFRDELLARGLVEVVKEEREAAVMGAPETATLPTGRRRGRGRS